MGLFVYYRDEKELTPDFINGKLFGVEETACIVEADSPEKAVETFFEKWEAAKIGGNGSEESKALWINRKKPIREIPSCEFLHKSKGNRFVCGEEVGKNGNGEFGMCVLEHYDAPEDCPIKEFTDLVWRLEEKDALPVNTISVAGKQYEVISVKDIMSVPVTST